MLHLRKDKRGVAIEMAVTFMVVIFVFCALIMTASFLIRSKDNQMTNINNTYFSLDQVGDDFVGMLRAGESNTTLVPLSGDGEPTTEEEVLSSAKGDWIKLTDVDYGVCIDSDESRNLFTLRAIPWNDVNDDGTENGNYSLIVTAMVMSDGEVKVINWSTSENQYQMANPTPETPSAPVVVKDVERSHSTFSWKWLWEFFKKFNNHYKSRRISSPKYRYGRH